jgi:hypothetical protein
MQTVERETSRADVASALITTRRWEPRREPEVVDLSEAHEGAGVLHFDVQQGADADVVYHALRPFCGPDLTRHMIVDLLDPDDLPEVKEQDDDGRVRAVSAFSVRAQEPATGAGTCSGSLSFELVEFLANDHWLISCSHRAESYAGGGNAEHTGGRSCGRLLKSVTRRWMNGDFGTAGDLGVLLLHELTCSYSDAWRAMSRWLDSWERGFYEDPHVEQETLKDLRGLLSEFGARLNALNVPEDEAGGAWFAGVTDARIAQRADRNIDKALRGLDRLSDMLRSVYGLLQAKNAEGLQRRLDIFTVVFLVPTLIAGTWGENTWVPGHGRPWGFVMTLGVMVTGAALVWLLIRARRTPRGARA